MTTRVVNIRHASYFDVYIGRNPKYGNPQWGNPFSHLPAGSTAASVSVANREEAVLKHKRYVAALMEDPGFYRDLRGLRGKILGCHCFPDRCHGETLAMLADATAFTKVIVAGSRSIDNLDVVERAIERSGLFPTEIVSGGAIGVDASAETWARNNGIPLKVIPAIWTDKQAGMRRNSDMARYVGHKGALVAIWDGASPGTRAMIDLAKQMGLEVFVEKV